MITTTMMMMMMMMMKGESLARFAQAPCTLFVCRREVAENGASPPHISHLVLPYVTQQDEIRTRVLYLGEL